MVMATLYVATVMSINHIYVCMHRLMFVKKEGFGKGVMQCNSDKQECKIGCMKNVICGICKCCSLSSSVVRLFATSSSNLRFSFRVLVQHSLLGKGEGLLLLPSNGPKDVNMLPSV